MKNIKLSARAKRIIVNVKIFLTFTIINILNQFKPEDVLDMKKTEVKRLPSGGIMYVSKHYFDKKVIEGRHIFSVHNLIVCDDEFKKTVEDNGLTGLCFQLLWQSDDNCNN